MKCRSLSLFFPAAIFGLVLLPAPGARAQTALPAAEVFAKTGVQSGLCVLAPAGDLSLGLGLNNNGRMLVQALTTGDALGLNRKAAEAALAGMVSARKVPDFARLPYADNMVNLLVVDGDDPEAKALSEAEAMRIIAPTGVLFHRQGGVWQKKVKPRPAEMGEWTHLFASANQNSHVPDRALKPTNSIRFMNGPFIASYGWGNRTGDGRLFQNFNVGDNGDKKATIGRDAYNGLLHWVSPATSQGAFYGGGRLYRHAPEGFLEAVDAGTGKRTLLYQQSIPLRNFFINDLNAHGWYHVLMGYHQEKIVQGVGDSVVAVDAATGGVAWRFKAAGSFVSRVVLDAGKAFILYCKRGDFRNDTGRKYVSPTGQVGNNQWGGSYGIPSDTVSFVVALDIASGKELWRNGDMAGERLHWMVSADGYLALAHQLQANRTQNWEKCPPEAIEENYLISIGHDGRTRFKRKGFDILPPTILSTMQFGISNKKAFFIAYLASWSYDCETGKRVDSIATGLTTGCERVVMTPDYLLIDHHQRFVGVDNVPAPVSNITRINCWGNPTPSNGLTYWTSDLGTSNFYLNLNRNSALAGQTPPPPLPPARRLERGPAAVSAAAPSSWPAAGEWPIHLGNTKRHRFTPSPLSAQAKPFVKVLGIPRGPAGPLTQDWDFSPDIPGPITAPTLAVGRAFVALPDQGRIESFDALDPEKGVNKPWSFTAGGRIEAPPTVYGGLCFFGAKDGYVYALSAADGKLAWRYFMGEYDQNIVVAGQVESSSPVRSSLLIHEGKLFAVAGRHSHADAGAIFVKLDPFTGAELGREVHDRTKGDGRTVDMLQTDGTLLYSGMMALHPKLMKATSFWWSPKGGGNYNHLILVQYPGVDTAVFPKFYIRNLLTHETYEKGNNLGWVNRNFDRNQYGKVIATKMALDERDTLFSVNGKTHVALAVAGATMVAARNDSGGCTVDMGPAVGTPAGVTARARLRAPCVEDGIALAHGRVYVSTVDGAVSSFGFSDYLAPVSVKRTGTVSAAARAQVRGALKGAAVGALAGRARETANASALTALPAVSALGARTSASGLPAGSGIASSPAPVPGPAAFLTGGLKAKRRGGLHEVWVDVEGKLSELMASGLFDRQSDYTGFVDSLALAAKRQSHIAERLGGLVVSRESGRHSLVLATGGEGRAILLDGNRDTVAVVVSKGSLSQVEVELVKDRAYFLEVLQLVRFAPQSEMRFEWVTPSGRRKTLDREEIFLD